MLHAGVGLGRHPAPRSQQPIQLEQLRYQQRQLHRHGHHRPFGVRCRSHRRLLRNLEPRDVRRRAESLEVVRSRVEHAAWTVCRRLGVPRSVRLQRGTTERDYARVHPHIWHSRFLRPFLSGRGGWWMGSHGQSLRSLQEQRSQSWIHVTVREGGTGMGQTNHHFEQRKVLDPGRPIEPHHLQAGRWQRVPILRILVHRKPAAIGVGYQYLRRFRSWWERRCPDLACRRNSSRQLRKWISWKRDVPKRQVPRRPHPS
mmetsp:Transcript_4457/g.12812  ORF Transcript_4457/g.12812 Transcript_4457/m.12812 type:complete len:257 (-) Transcript_4457:363-1133(-)